MQLQKSLFSAALAAILTATLAAGTAEASSAKSDTFERPTSLKPPASATPTPTPKPPATMPVYSLNEMRAELNVPAPSELPAPTVAPPLAPAIAIAPPPAAAEPSAPPPKPWLAREGKTLRDTLREWAQEEGWSVVWRSDRNYILAASAEFEGDFIKAAGELLAAFAKARPPVFGEFYTANRVLLVTTQPDQDNQ